MKKKIFTVAVTLIVLLNMINIGFVGYSITRSEVVVKLNDLINKYNTKKATSSELYMGIQCKGFANWVFLQLFNVYIGPYPESANYKISNANANLVGMLEPGYLNKESAENLLKKGMPGDYIQVQRSTDRGRGPHSMILVDVYETGIEVFDCNSDGKNTIKKYFISWEKFDNDNRAMSLYHARNYDVTSNYVNLGDDFYAYIVNTGSSKNLTNDYTNVSIRKETGNANQVWQFLRQSDGSYKILNCKDGLALDVHESGTTDGTNVKVYKDHGTDAQRWYISGTSGKYNLISKCNNLLLDVSEGSSNEGTNVQVWTKNNTSAQDFQIRKLNKVGATTVSYQKGTAYAPTKISWSAVSGAKEYDVKIWKGKIWDGEPYKIVWGVKGTSCLVDLPVGYYEAYVDSKNNYSLSRSNNEIKFTIGEGSNKNLGDSFYSYITINNYYLTEVNSNVQLEKNSSTINQIWEFKRQSDGSYIIKSCASGNVFDVDCAVDKNGTNVQTYSTNNSNAQKWLIFDNGSGKNYLRPKCSTSRVLDVSGGALQEKSNIQIWEVNYTEAQKFNIIKVDSSIVESRKKFTIKYDANGGNNAPSTQQKNYNVDIKISGTIPTKTGYTFLGWTSQKGSSKVEYTSGSTYKNNANVTLYAVWTPKKYSIVYDLNGGTGSISNQSKSYGTDIKISETIPTKTGYTFLGWTSQKGSSKVEYTSGSTYKNNANVILYAVWTPEKYSIVYDLNGGIGDITNQDKTYNEDIALSEEIPTKNYEITFDLCYGNEEKKKESILCSFLGWSTSINNQQTDYNPGDIIKENKDIILYASWSNPQIGNILFEPKREGYCFEGWFTSKNGGSEITEKSIVENNLSLYAHWSEEKKYKISYNANGGDISVVEQTKKENEDIIITSAIPTRLGYKFKGWSTNLNGVTVEYNSGDIYNKNENVTLYAVWEPEKYIISYNLNNGVGDIKEQIKEHDIEIEIPNTIPSKIYTITYDACGGSMEKNKESYSCEFLGWSLYQDSKTVDYVAGDLINENKNITLYAVWSNPTVGHLETPVKDGYEFVGWFKDTSGKNPVNEDFEINSDTTIYAQWNEVSYDNIPQFVVTSGAINCGENIVVDIIIKNNPGITSFKLKLDYPDEILELTDVEYKDLFSTSATGGNEYKNPFIISWYSTKSEDEYCNGVIASFVFKVNEKAEAGSYKIKLSYDNEDIFNSLFENQSFEVEDGEITVHNEILGDVNGDSTINMKDIVLLQQYLNGYDVYLDKNTADVNFDSKINMKDIVLLQQYLNGWDVVFGKEYT